MVIRLILPPNTVILDTLIEMSFHECCIKMLLDCLELPTFLIYLHFSLVANMKHSHVAPTKNKGLHQCIYMFGLERHLWHIRECPGL